MAADAPKQNPQQFKRWLEQQLAPLPPRAHGLFAAACATRVRNAVEPALPASERQTFEKVRGLLQDAWTLAAQEAVDTAKADTLSQRADALADAALDEDDQSLVAVFAEATESTLAALARPAPTFFDKVSALFGETSTPVAYYAAVVVLELIETLLERGELKDVEEDERFWQHRRFQQELARQERDVKQLAAAGKSLEVALAQLRATAEQESA